MARPGDGRKKTSRHPDICHSQPVATHLFPRDYPNFRFRLSRLATRLCVPASRLIRPPRWLPGACPNAAPRRAAPVSSRENSSLAYLIIAHLPDGAGESHLPADGGGHVADRLGEARRICEQPRKGERERETFLRYASGGVSFGDFARLLSGQRDSLCIPHKISIETVSSRIRVFRSVRFRARARARAALVTLNLACARAILQNYFSQ